MNKNFSKSDIEAVFASMNLPLIDRGIEEVQLAKDRMKGDGEPVEPYISQRILFGNGTLRQSTRKADAELERGSR